VIAPHGMAATSQPLATQIAVEILKLGGSAVDAAIAANAALGSWSPRGAGSAGTFRHRLGRETEKLYGLNASGRSPASLDLDVFAKAGLKRIPARGPFP